MAVGINKEIVRENVGFKTKGIEDDAWQKGILDLSYDIEKSNTIKEEEIQDEKNIQEKNTK